MKTHFISTHLNVIQQFSKALEAHNERRTPEYQANLAACGKR